MRLETILPCTRIASVYDSRFLYKSTKSKLLVALNVTINELDIYPGIAFLFTGVKCFSIGPSGLDQLLSAAELNKLNYGLLFELSHSIQVDDKQENLKTYLVNAYPNKTVQIQALSYKVLRTDFRLR